MPDTDSNVNQTEQQSDTPAAQVCDPDEKLKYLATLIAKASSEVKSAEEHLAGLTTFTQDREKAFDDYTKKYEALAKKRKEVHCDVEGYRAAAGNHLRQDQLDAIKKCQADYEKEAADLQQAIDQRMDDLQAKQDSAAAAKRSLESAITDYQQVVIATSDWSAQLTSLFEQMAAAQASCDWCLLYLLVLEIDSVAANLGDGWASSLAAYKKDLDEKWCAIYEAQDDSRGKQGLADECAKQLEQAIAKRDDHAKTRWAQLLECVRSVADCGEPDGSND